MGLGSPVDLANLALRGGAAVLNATTGSDIQLPVDTVGGYQTFRQLLAPTIAPESDDPINQIARRGLQEVGSTLIPSGIHGRVARTGRSAASELKTVASDVATAAGAGAGAGIAQQIAPDNPYLELAGQLLGGTAAIGLTQGAKHVITPFPVDPNRQAANEVMAREGIDISAGQWTDSPWLRRVESELGDGPATFNENQREQFTQAALAHAGISAPRATPQVITRAYDEIGAQLDAVAARNPLKPDEQLLREFESVAKSYNSNLAESMRVPFVVEMANALDRYERFGWPISGNAYRNMRSSIRSFTDRKGNDEDLTQALRGFQAALDDAMERSMLAAESPDIGDWQQARSDYRNLTVLQNAADPDGLISPDLLDAAVRTSREDPYVLGQSGELPGLAHAGTTTMTPLPQRRKWVVQGLDLGMPAAMGAAMGYDLGGDMIDTVPGALAGAAVGKVASNAAGRLLHSDPVFGYLTNQLLTEPSDVAKLLVAPSIGGVINNVAQPPDDPDPPLSILVEGAQAR
ncbi:hypothetical protein [Devosia nitrariae]|uniref:Large polyvalent protein associated domain-containing protein n=1 Tax=Devosia nitrariae TaxID=2071872 RepID=A0ABQ5W101_9HYPH|nr:hypothetical protein [Devosia nitrariae]GLQ53750.1 hypothetical protein GCM10010862_10090 [Devosia nitrariae]